MPAPFGFVIGPSGGLRREDQGRADLRERIAAEAVRIAEGANDIDPLKELAAEYAEVCAAAGVAIQRKGDSELIVSAAIKPLVGRPV